MPRGLVIVTSVNGALLTAFLAYLVLVFYAGETVRTLNFLCSWIAVAGLLASLFGTLMRTPFWHRMSRVALYVIILGFGVQVMGMVPQILQPSSLVSMLGLGVLIFYLVGARGYLNSAPARAWFRAPALPAGPDPAESGPVDSERPDSAREESGKD